MVKSKIVSDNNWLHGLTSCAVGHRSIAARFKPQLGYVRRGFHLSFRLTTLEGRSAHLAHLVHKDGRRKTATFTFTFSDTSRCSTTNQAMHPTMTRSGPDCLADRMTRQRSQISSHASSSRRSTAYFDLIVSFLVHIIMY
jgi:hypothetical protein